MLKFFRKYNKWILAVGGTLLMITFLIPQAIQGLSQFSARRTAKWATLSGTGGKTVSVSLAEREDIQRQMKLLDEINPAVLDRFDAKTPEHWFLLVREAEEAGLVGGQSDGLRELPEPRDDSLAMLRARTGESPHFILKTFANVRGVNRLQAEWINASQFSDRRLKFAARRLYHNVNGNMVVIKADKPEQPFEPTEAQISEQFEKYKDVSPGEGDKGLGYKLPDRVKLEWIEVSADSVRNMVEHSEAMSGVALRKHWSKHASRLGVDPPSGGGPVPEKVRNDLLQELLAKTLAEIAKFGGDELDSAERGLARSAGFLVLPEDWPQRQPSYEHLAQRIQEQFKIDLPAYHAIGDRWLTIDEVADLQGVGEATTLQYGQVPVDLASLVANERSFRDDSTIGIQKGIAGPALSGPDGSVYFFRIIDADPAHAPSTADEVRDEIVKDLAREAHYRELEARVDELRSAAIEMGLLRFALAHSTAVHPSGLVNERMQPQLPEVGYDESLVTAIVDKALQLPPGIAVADMTPDMKTLVVPVEDKLAIVVFEITASNPLTEETYRSIASPMQNPSIPQMSSTLGQLQITLRTRELENGELAAKAFAYDAIAKRHNFTVISAQEEGGTSEGETDDATGEPATASTGG